MTCIVGMSMGHDTVIAADSCASDEVSVETRLEPKVWMDGRYVVSSCPSFRLMQILRYNIDFDGILGCPHELTIKDICHILVPELKFHILAEPGDGLNDWNILFGGYGNLWSIDAYYAVHEVENFTALGSGSDYALGALHSRLTRARRKNYSIDPVATCCDAVEAACAYSNSCSSPIVYRMS